MEFVAGTGSSPDWSRSGPPRKRKQNGSRRRVASPLRSRHIDFEPESQHYSRDRVGSWQGVTCGGSCRVGAAVTSPNLCIFVSLVIGSFAGSPAVRAQVGPSSVAARTIDIETSSVTDAGIDIAPDGLWICFTLLGHLFRLPTEGGEAEQLTFGAVFDRDPVISPDGRSIAFVSDRDGSDGNVHVLELETRAIRRITDESHAARPSWSPDGRSLVYLVPVRSQARSFWQLAGYLPFPGIVKRVAADGTTTETIVAEPSMIRSLFHLPDGRLAWSLVEKKTTQDGWISRIESVETDGRRSILMSVDGYVDRVLPGLDDREFFARRYETSSSTFPPRGSGQLVRLSSAAGAKPTVIMAAGASLIGPGFGLSRSERRLVIGHAGRLWSVDPDNGSRSPIQFHARVRKEVAAAPAPPRRPAVPDDAAMAATSVSNAIFLPSSDSVVFEAAGYLFRQSGRDGVAHRLFEGNGYERLAAASPDGKSLAFVRSVAGQSEIVVVDLATSRQRIVASGAQYGWAPSWSPNARQLLVTEYRGGPPTAVAVSLEEGTTRVMVSDTGWFRRPHFSGDGKSIYFTGKLHGRWTVYRQSTAENLEPLALVSLDEDLAEAVVCADGKHIVFRRGPGLYVAPLSDPPATESDVVALTTEVIGSFTLTRDDVVVYSSAGRIWSRPLAGGPPHRIDLKPEIERNIPRAMLIRRVRVLDLDKGAFTPETVIYIERGRIAGIGPPDRESVTEDVVELDAGGRFAIPGLFDYHAHAEWGGWSSQAAFIAYGVTSIREPGGTLDVTMALAERAAATDEPIPRYFPSGDAFQGVGTGSAATIANAEDAHKFVLAWSKEGAQFLKMYPSLRPSIQAHVVREARALGLPVAAHGMSVEEIVHCATWGCSVVEHSLSYGRIHDDLIQLLVATGMRWDPTLVMQGGSIMLARNEPSRLQDEKLRRLSSEGCRSAPLTSSMIRDIDDRTLRGEWAERSEAILDAYRAGVKLQAGTDDHGADWLCLPGLSLHWELELLARSGIPPGEVLKIATRQAAEALGVDADLGSLKPGKLADIVFLDADPLEDIRNSQRIWRVIKGGHLFDPADLTK